MLDQAENLRQLVRQRQIEEGFMLPGCKIITITSGKGGVGKTNLTVNLAISFALMNKRVLILDADLGLSNVNIVIGLVPPPKYNLFHVISGQKEIKEILADGPCGVKVITGAVGVTRLSNISARKRKQFIDKLSSLFDSFDLILIDTSAGISPNVLSFILAANEVVLITTPEPTAIADAYGVIKASSSMNNDVNLKLVVNRITNIMEGKKVADRIVNIAGQFLNVKVENVGYLLDDPVVARAVREQAPFFLAYPKSKATDCIYHIRNKLANIPDDSLNYGIKGFFKRLFSSNGDEHQWD
ncbi:MAG: MinD/ParA family protein [bacterium]